LEQNKSNLLKGLGRDQSRDSKHSKEYMKKILSVMVCASLSLGAMAQETLAFDANAGMKSKMTVYDGTEVNYTAYERLFYVTNVEDSTYQYLNVYVPDGATQQTPIFLRTYVGGYMASPAAQPQAGDATGRALKEGYVVVIPGTRGRNSSIVADKVYAKKHRGVKKGQTIYTGRAPKAILDLKAAIRYLRNFDKQMPGDAERIITDGTSAGGAMSALMGATGNNPEYAELLKAMGAADERDDVFASVCFCPIIDLAHADMAYEWLYQQTDSRQSLDNTHRQLTKELAAMFPSYVNSLNLKKPDGTPLNADNYLDYLKSEIIRAAQIAKNAGADIPDSIGFSFSRSAGGMFAAPINGGMRPQMQGDKRPMMQGGQPSKGMRPMRGVMGRKQVGEYITDLDMQKYLNYVVSTQALKGVPAFDSQIEGINSASGENEEFGDETGSSLNFTEYTAQKNGTTVSDAIRQNVRLMNPMSFIGDGKTSVAPHWYIRHGARDRDTAFPVPINFATKLQNAGKEVNFLLAWNRPHSGDYALDELFAWIADIVKK
jgi:acetyl esterase/lipase